MLAMPISIVTPLLGEKRSGDTVQPSRDLIALGHSLVKSSAFGAGPLQLMPTSAKQKAAKGRQRGATGLGLLLAAGCGTGLMLAATPDASNATAEAERAETRAVVAQAKLASQVRSDPNIASVANLASQRTTVLDGDVDWQRVMKAIFDSAPADSPLVAITGARSPAGDVKSGVGNLALTVQGTQANASAWIAALEKSPLLIDPWPGRSNAANGSGLSTMSIAAKLSDAARSNRTASGVSPGQSPGSSGGPTP